MGNSESRIASIGKLSTRCSEGHKTVFAFGSSAVNRAGILQEETFHSMLTLERLRAERSRRQFVLMLLDASAFVEAKAADHLMSQVTSVLLKSTRETDLVGWHKKGAILGVIFNEIRPEFKNPIIETLYSKVVNALHDDVGREIASNLLVTAHLFPESWDRDEVEQVADTKLYPDLSGNGSTFL
jgi:hypothetical protein